MQKTVVAGVVSHCICDESKVKIQIGNRGWTKFRMIVFLFLWCCVKWLVLHEITHNRRRWFGTKFKMIMSDLHENDIRLQPFSPS